jgi:hypothetical protein
MYFRLDRETKLALELSLKETHSSQQHQEQKSKKNTQKKDTSTSRAKDQVSNSTDRKERRFRSGLTHSAESIRDGSRMRNVSGGYHGIVNANGRWLSQIYHKGQWRVIGSFDSSVEAACAHDEMALRLNGGLIGEGKRPLNLEPFDGPVCRFGYGLVQSQAFDRGGLSMDALRRKVGNPGRKNWVDALIVETLQKEKTQEGGVVENK